MKIGILIPLRAKSTTSEWATVCNNLHRTLKSIADQTSDQFQAIVVGHDQPDFPAKNFFRQTPRIDFLNYRDTEPLGLNETYLEYEFDRCRKILCGMLHLQYDRKITHWYALDADDLLHPEFIESLSDLGDAPAIIINRGYSYFENLDLIQKENEFSSYCGSCTILSTRLISLGDDIGSEDFRATLFGGVPHNQMSRHLESQGIEIRFPKKRLVMYMRGHGSNLSDMRKHCTKLSKIKFLIKTVVKRPWRRGCVARAFKI